MASYKKYLNEMSKKFGMHAVWTPGTPIELGDVGEFKDGIFRRIGNIRDMGHAFEARISESPEELNYQSEKSVSVSIKAQGDAVPVGSALANMDAGFSIGFGKGGGVLFKAENAHDHSIKDQLSLRKFLLENYNNGTFQKKWVIINELKEAGSATVIYSSTSNAQIDLKANANIGTENLSLTNASLGLGIVREKGMETKVIAQSKVTPLFRVLGLKKKLIGKDRVVARGMKDRESAPKPEVLTDDALTEIKPIKNVYALLVGINQYFYASDLNGCENDVNRFAAYLKSLPSDYINLVEPKLLLSQEATKENIVKGFNDYLGQAQKGDLCLFYFSGHGAQEHADRDAFKLAEHDGKIEVRACHFSSTNISGSFLADKEIRYLIKKLTDNGAETVVILDSCHSGTGVRGTKVARRLSNSVPKREWKDFIFSDTLTQTQVQSAEKFDDVLPLGDYVNLSACEAEQSAWEVKGGGVFSANLLQLLQQTGGNITYCDLHSRLRLLIDAQTFRGEKQTPQIDVNPDYLCDGHFLGDVGEAKPLQFNVVYDDKQKCWLLDAGAVHGLQADDANLVIEIVENGISLTEACISQIQPAKSVLDMDDGAALDEDKTYTAKIEGLFLPQLSIWLTGDNEGVAIAKAYFENKNIPNLRISDSQAGANYVLQAKNGDYIIADSEFLKPMVRQERGYENKTLDQVKEYISGIAKWEFIKNMRHPDEYNKHITDGKGVDVIVEWKDKDGNWQKQAQQGGELKIPYAANNAVDLKISVQNKNPQTLYLALLVLNIDFGIMHKLLDPSSAVHPNNTVHIMEGQPIPIKQEAHTKAFNLKEETMYLKLIASTKSMDNMGVLKQDGLPKPEVTRTRGDDAASKGFEKRGWPDGNVNPKSDFWFTQLVGISNPNPDYDATEYGVEEATIVEQ